MYWFWLDWNRNPEKTKMWNQTKQLRWKKMILKKDSNCLSLSPSKLQKTKTLNCTNNFASCTPNRYFIKKTYKWYYLSNLWLFTTLMECPTSTTECRTFSSRLLCRTAAWGSGKYGGFLSYILGIKPKPNPSVTVLSPPFAWHL